MSFLTRPILRSASCRSCPRTGTQAVCRPFHISSPQAALSESDHGRHEERKADIDHHKNDQLKKQEEGKNDWKKELSSNSESAIKADREEVDDAGKDIEAMQKETSDSMQSDHEHGKR